MPLDTARVMREAMELARRHTPAATGRLRRPLPEVVRLLRDAKARRVYVTATGEAPLPDGAQFVTRSFACAAGSRAYKLYLPKSRGAERPALVVMLHGCTQNPDDFARGTRMNALAEEFGFVAAYPQQTAADNPSSCWNWFQPKDQTRGTGEPALIAGITREVADEFGADSGRVFVAGLSAGGAMAAVMGATYPDIYAAIGVHSGLAVGCATDVVSAFAAMRGDHSHARDPAPAHHPRTIIFHGDCDQTVHPSNAERIVAHSADGARREVERSEHGGRACTCTTVRGARGNAHLEYWTIGSAGHAWSGGDASGSFTDATGPDASREMVRFFLS